MSEASSGRAAGGEPGGHEAPTTAKVELIWQCTASCHAKLEGIRPNSFPFCPFCQKLQKGFSHSAPGDVSGHRPKSPQSTAQEEHSQHGTEEPDVITAPDASSSTKSNNGVEVNPPAASKRSGEETPPPSLCLNMDGARDHDDSPEPGTKAVSSPQLPLAASAATPSSPSTELHPPSHPLPPPHLPPDGPRLPSGDLPSSPTGTPLPPGDSLPSQTGPALLPGNSPSSETGPALPPGNSPPSHPPDGSPLLPEGPPSPQTGLPPPLSKDQPPEPSNQTEPQPLSPSVGAPIPTTGHPLSEAGSPQDNTEAPLPNHNPATNSKSTQPSPTSDERDSDLTHESPPPGKRRKVSDERPSCHTYNDTPPLEDKGGQNGAKGVGGGEPGNTNVSPLSQPDKQNSSPLGRRPHHNDQSGATSAAAHTVASTDKERRRGPVESEAGQRQPGAGSGPAAHTRSQTGQVSIPYRTGNFRG